MPPNQNLFDSFSKAAQQFPNKPAILFKSSQTYTSISYQELLHKTIKLSNILQAEGITSDDKVGILLENEPEYVCGFFGVMAAGATAVPMDVQLPIEQIRLFIVHAQIKVLLVNKKIYARLKHDFREIKILVLDEEDFQKRWDQSSDKFNSSVPKNELAVLFYTSGTTDLPKAVMLSHGNLLSNVDSICQLKIVTDHDRVIAFLPLHHAYAFTVTLLTPLFVGATVVYPPSLNSADLISCLKDNQITVFVGVPQVFSLIYNSIENKMKALPKNKKFIVGLLGNVSQGLQKNFGINLGAKIFKQIHESFGGHLRFMVSGGARLDPLVANAFIKWGFTILEGYGLTETSPVATFNLPKKFKIGSVGKSLPNVEVKIIKENEEVGEVAIKGPNVMQGYYLREDKTKEVLKDGWFYTGDLGYKDKDGFIFLVGRKKEIIVLSSGKNIHPDEIETQYGHCTYIKEIAVLTKTEQNALGVSEHLVAIIVINEDLIKERNEINARERLKWEFENISAKLPTYKRIMGFVMSKDPLPRTRLGKIMRYQLPALYKQLEERLHVAEHPAQRQGQNEIDNKALDCIQEILKKPVQLNDHLELDLGLDSLSRVELLLDLQERLNLNLTEDEQMEFFSCNIVAELKDKLQKHMPESASSEKLEEKHFLWKKTLEEDPPPDLLQKIKLEFNFGSLFFNVVMISFLKFLFMILFFLRSQGRNHLPAKGPYLICSNHSSYLDGLFVLCALPYKVIFQTYFVGLSAFFEHFLLRPFIKIARLIPIEENLNFIEAMKTIAYVLRSGKIVCYFPEGQRSIDGEIKEFKKGVGILIKELNIPVVPVYIEGSFGTWSRGQKFPRFTPVKVIFGPPQTAQDLMTATPQGSEVYQNIAMNLQNKVVQLRG
jgi:long-chain acyl-CoA synthetase